MSEFERAEAPDDPASKVDPDNTAVNEPMFEQVPDSGSVVTVRRLNRKRIMLVGGGVLALVFIMMAFQMFETSEPKQTEQEDAALDLSETPSAKLSEMEKRAQAQSAERVPDQQAELMRGAPTELEKAEALQKALEAKVEADEQAAEEEDKENPWKKAQEESTRRRAQEYYAQGISARGASVLAQVQEARSSRRDEQNDTNKYDPEAEKARFQARLNQARSDALGSVMQMPQMAAQQDQKLDFHESAHQRPTRSYERLSAPISRFVVQAGTVLPLVLETGISSDLPGFVKARFSSPVYDSVTGQYLLIPSGTTVLGEYNSTVAFGQERIQVAWTRMILPNGKSMPLGGIPAVDLAGQSGISDQVNNHWGKVIAAAGLSSLFSASAAAAAGPTNRLESSPQEAALGGFATEVAETGTDVVDKQLNVPPSLTIRPGFQMAAFVREDLVLEPWKGEQ